MTTLDSTFASMKSHGSNAWNKAGELADSLLTFLIHFVAVLLMGSAQGLLMLNDWMHKPQFGVAKETR